MIKALIFLFSLILSGYKTMQINPDGTFRIILVGMGYFILNILILAFLFFFIAFLLTFFLNKNKKPEHYSSFYKKIYTIYCKLIISLFGVKISVEGLEKLPKDQKCLFVQNHVSNMDPIIMNYVLKDEKIIFVSKNSLFKIPFFGKMINKIGYVHLVRDNPKDDVREINRAIEWLGNDECSVFVYPEGTRNKHPETEKLQEFKSGCFKIATKNKAPIVITTISGTENINNHLLTRKHKIVVKIVDVITEEDYKNDNTQEIGELVYNTMDANFEYHKELEN